MNDQFEYWDLECRMSKDSLYNVLYSVIMLGGSIPSTFEIGCRNLTMKQNSRHYCFLKIKLPKGKSLLFEEMTRYKLEIPPQVHLN